MITDEERQSIINEAVEKAMLMLPEIVGNLMMSQVNILKMNRTFYEQHPEFATNKDLVASVIEKVEGEDPAADYKEILNKAVPIIREHLKTTKSLNFKSVPRPSRDLSSLQTGLKSDHGEL